MSTKDVTLKILLFIVLGKAAMNPEHEAQGARQAGYTFNNLSKLQVTGFRYLNDVTFNANQKNLFESQPQMRKDMNVLDDNEVKDLILEKIDQISNDVQIIFKQFLCKACGVEGDHRLLPLYCHMEKVSIHEKSYKRVHPKGT